MTFRRETNRADDSDDSDGIPTVDCETNADGLTADQHREWRRWIVETFLPSNYGVVPVDHLVDEIIEREPEDIDRSTVRSGLTETILPELDHEGVLSYDDDQELLINYGN